MYLYNVIFQCEKYIIISIYSEIGHIVHRKFKTDKIYRRISGKLVETIHHEFYQLVGNLRDTKHG